MPKCPFCGEEINSVHVYIEEMHKYEFFLDDEKFLCSNHLEVERDELHAICICPKCEEELPFTLWKVGDFLREKYIILRSDDPEIKRKGDFVIYRGRAYKTIDESKMRGGRVNLLHLRLVKDEFIADILKANIE